jgi:lipopolysaccharide export system protein LptA
MSASQDHGAGLAAQRSTTQRSTEQRSTASRQVGFKLPASSSKALSLLLMLHSAAVSAQPALAPVPVPVQAQPRVPQAVSNQALPLTVVTPAEGANPAGTTPAATTPAATASPPTPARLNTGLVTIESDQQRADQATGVVTATGNVRIVYPDQRVVATARQAQYFSKEGRVVLSGDVDIVQTGGNLLRAERVIYLVESERLIAIPPQGQQVFSQMRMESSAPAAQPAQPAQP